MKIYWDDQDAFGHAVHDFYESSGTLRSGFQIIEREDGYVDVDNPKESTGLK